MPYNLALRENSSKDIVGVILAYDFKFCQSET